MPDIQAYVLYASLFISLFFEVFLLITYLEVKGEMKKEDELVAREPSYFPTVSIIVPVWNEEATLEATMDSLLALDYPKDRLSFMIVDDGSTDGTWSLTQELV